MHLDLSPRQYCQAPRAAVRPLVLRGIYSVPESAPSFNQVSSRRRRNQAVSPMSADFLCSVIVAAALRRLNRLTNPTLLVLRFDGGLL